MRPGSRIDGVEPEAAVAAGLAGEGAVRESPPAGNARSG